MAEVPRAGVEEIDAAVAAGEGGLPGWRARRARATAPRCCTASRRARGPRARTLATLEARNAGKPIGDARGEIGMVVETFRYYAGAPERLLGQTIPVAGGVDMTFREPLGVVGLIVPWNFPLMIASWKVAPALAAGNTVVLKPAALTPLTRARAGADRARRRACRGRPQRRRRAGQRLRQAPRRAPRRRQDRLHRLDRGRARDRRGGRGDDQARHPGAGRQVGERRLRRRRPRGRGRRGAAGRRSATPARTAARARGSWSSGRRSTTSWRRSRSAVRGDAGRRPARRGDRRWGR